MVIILDQRIYIFLRESQSLSLICLINLECTKNIPRYTLRGLIEKNGVPSWDRSKLLIKFLQNTILPNLEDSPPFIARLEFQLLRENVITHAGLEKEDVNFERGLKK